MIKVILLNEHNIKKLPSQKKFQQWIDQVNKTIPEKISKNYHEVCISIIDKKTSAELNETYRHKKGPTNVLSFPYDPIPGIISKTLGDLAICAELVITEAQAQDKKPESHWAHLTIHGVLHLLGYDHIIDADADIMEALEVKILGELGFNNPY